MQISTGGHSYRKAYKLPITSGDVGSSEFLAFQPYGESEFGDEVFVEVEDLKLGE